MMWTGSMYALPSTMHVVEQMVGVEIYVVLMLCVNTMPLTLRRMTMLTTVELHILREALDLYAQGVLNRELSAQIQEIERKLSTMMQVQGSG